jgi:hypothetical protein
LNDDADLWVRTGEHVALTSLDPPPAAGPAGALDGEAAAEEVDDADPASTGPVGVSRARLLVGVGLVAVACLLLGYLVGWARGSADLDRGAATTTSVVTLPSQPATSAPPTTAGTTLPPTPGPELPPVEATTFDFADGLPGALEASDGTAVVDGELVTGPVDPLPEDQPKPRLLDTAPQVRASNGAPVTVASVRLAQPSARAVLAFAIAGDASWQLAVAPDLQSIVLYEVRGAEQQQRAFLDLDVQPGTVIGLFLVDGQVGITVDGGTRTFQSFFGPSGSISAAGIEGSDVALIAGDGTTAFDDLTIG